MKYECNIMEDYKMYITYISIGDPLEWDRESINGRGIVLYSYVHHYSPSGPRGRYVHSYLTDQPLTADSKQIKSLDQIQGWAAGRHKVDSPPGEILCTC